jgi:hypothetical protein
MGLFPFSVRAKPGGAQKEMNLYDSSRNREFGEAAMRKIPNRKT